MQFDVDVSIIRKDPEERIRVIFNQIVPGLVLDAYVAIGAEEYNAVDQVIEDMQRHRHIAYELASRISNINKKDEMMTYIEMNYSNAMHDIDMFVIGPEQYADFV